MADQLTIVTNFKNPDGTAFNGTLYVSLYADIQLAEGGTVPAGRWPFPVVNGEAQDENGVTMKLPITEDANPSYLPLYLALVDQQGRKTTPNPIAYVPRSDAASVTLEELQTLG